MGNLEGRSQWQWGAVKGFLVWVCVAFSEAFVMIPHGAYGETYPLERRKKNHGLVWDGRYIWVYLLLSIQLAFIHLNNLMMVDQSITSSYAVHHILRKTDQVPTIHSHSLAQGLPDNHSKHRSYLDRENLVKWRWLSAVRSWTSASPELIARSQSY